MTEFLTFFAIIFAGLLFSEVFRRLHLPWVIALIIGGIIIGPSVFGMVDITGDKTIAFFAEIGLVFLMFIAGLETNMRDIGEHAKKVSFLAFANGFVPFLVGFGIGHFFGYPIMTSLLLGVIFISSSIAVVIPVMESRGIIKTELGKSIIASTIFQDVASLVLLSILLQSFQPVTTLPLPWFYAILFLFLLILRYVMPRIQKWIKRELKGSEKIFQKELRAVFLILLGTVVVFELLGLHPIIAGFFAGLVLSGTLVNPRLKEKLRTISYGIFIPIFFVTVGIQTDIMILKTAGVITAAIVLGSIVSKYVSGLLAAKVSGFNWSESRLFAVTSMPQLSTTLAVVFLGAEIGLLDNALVTSLIALTIVTTLLTPFFINNQLSKES